MTKRGDEQVADNSLAIRGRQQKGSQTRSPRALIKRQEGATKRGDETRGALIWELNFIVPTGKSRATTDLEV